MRVMVLVLVLFAMSCSATLPEGETVALDTARLRLRCNGVIVVDRKQLATSKEYEIHGCGRVIHFRCSGSTCVHASPEG